MKLYLVQHGDAIPEQVDPERPLTEPGRADVQALAALMASAGIGVDRVIHSGKFRARQTAEIIASSIAPDVTVREIAAGLNPKDSTDWLTENLERWNDDTMAVGHQPFMGRLVARLLTGSENAAIVSFVPGTAVCLECSAPGETWTLRWMLPPDLLRS